VASKDQQVTDMDAPLSESIQALQTNFNHYNPQIIWPPRSSPSLQWISRISREKIHRRYVAHPLSKVHNDYLRANKTEPSTMTNSLGAVQLTTYKRELEELPVMNLLDALERHDLHWKGFLVVGAKADSKGNFWFSFPAYLHHLDYVKSKAVGGKLVSLQVFLTKEIQFRALVFSDLKNPMLELNLDEALAKARSEVGDLWNGLYSAPPGSGAMSALYVDPAIAQIQNQAVAAEEVSTRAARQKPGVQRASSAAEKTPDGKAATIKSGLTSELSNAPCPDGQTTNICKKFASGKGCPSWPCGGAHCCDLVKSDGSRRLGWHSRVNCPLNK